MHYKPAIGLEIHARLFSENKIFCKCKNSFGGEPNTRICPVCTGDVGAMPVLDKEAALLGVKAGIVLGCEINNVSSFDRKYYDSPDLPKGYQITQQYTPVCINGGFELNGKKRRINNIHLEEDAAKIVYAASEALIDFNRSGTPLIEIVTEPDFESSTDAAEFVEELALRLKYAGVSDAKIEQGSLRVDVNISVAPESSMKFGTRCEIKNIGSIKSLRRAIEFEIKRQCEILESGGTVISETLRFDEASGETRFMRKKESAEDYRYTSDPDVPDFIITDNEINDIKSAVPVLPSVRAEYYVSKLGLALEEAKNIVSDRDFSDWFELVCSKTKNYKKAASLMLVGLNRLFNKYGGSVSDLKISPSGLSDLADLWGNGDISSASAFEVLEKMFITDAAPFEIAKSEGMLISFDKENVKTEIIKVLSENEKTVLEYKAGNKKLFGYFMGILVSKLGKSVNPSEIKKVLDECIQNW